METSIDIVVRSTEIDILGHVNNAKYLEYMEWSRVDWYHHAGLTFGGELGTVAVNININYLKEARLGDALTVKTRPLRRGRTSFVLVHEIFRSTGEKIAEAQITSVAMDMNSRKNISLPEMLAQYFA